LQLGGHLIASVRGLYSARWKAKGQNCSFQPRRGSNDMFWERTRRNLCHEVPKIGRFYPHSNAQRVQPFSAIGFSDYVRTILM